MKKKPCLIERQGSSDMEKETKQIGSLDAGQRRKFTLSRAGWESARLPHPMVASRLLAAVVAPRGFIGNLRTVGLPRTFLVVPQR